MVNVSDVEIMLDAYAFGCATRAEFYSPTMYTQRIKADKRKQKVDNLLKIPIPQIKKIKKVKGETIKKKKPAKVINFVKNKK